MQQKSVAGVIAVLTIAVSMWLLVRAPDALPAPDEAAGGPAATNVDPVAASGQAPSATADPGAPPATTRAAAGAPVASAPRPLPADATWVDVVVVDGQTGAPVADAEVHWTDELSLALGRAACTDAEWLALPKLPIEALAALAGWRTRSDARGRARVTVRETTQIAARRDERYGTLPLRANTLAPAEGHRVLLYADRTLVARVIDDAGAPVAGVPIGVASRNADGMPVGRHGFAVHARSDADGLAAIPHVQLLANEFAAARSVAAFDKPPFTHFVRAVLPGLDAAGPAIDLDAPPPQVELRLPPHGSVRVRATLDGAPLPGFRTARLREDDAAPDATPRRQYWETAHRPAAVGADGSARMLHVPLGRSWHVSTPDVGGCAAVIAGPAIPGQQIEVTLSPARDRCVVRGRLFAAAGEPLRRTAVRVVAQAEPHRRDVAVEVATDDDGRFVASFEALPEADATATLVIDWQRRDAPPRRSTLSDRRLLAGPCDLGDVVLGEPPRLVSGRIERDGAPFAGPCTFEVQRAPAAAAPPAEAPLPPEVVGNVAADGRFVVFGASAPGPHTLVVRASDGARSRPAPFQPGADGVVVALVGMHPLAARALAPDGVPASLVAFELAAVDPRPDAANGGSPRHAGEVSSNKGIDVRWRELPAGRYELQVRVFTRSTPVLAIPDVVVPAPADGDPRLRAIDLRGALRALTLRLYDAGGQRLAKVYGLLAPGEAAALVAGGERRTALLWEWQQAFPLPAGPYDLMVYVYGYRPQPLRGDADRADVRLEPWPEAEVRFADLPQLPAGCELMARLDAQTQSAGDAAATVVSKVPIDAVRLPPPDWRPVVGGVVRLPIGDGRHALAVELRRPLGPEGQFARSRLGDVAPNVITWTGTPVVATAPAPAWQAALDALAEPPAPPVPVGGAGR
jgi:hypothetical protein